MRQYIVLLMCAALVSFVLCGASLAMSWDASYPRYFAFVAGGAAVGCVVSLSVVITHQLRRWDEQGHWKSAVPALLLWTILAICGWWLPASAADPKYIPAQHRRWCHQARASVLYIIIASLLWLIGWAWWWAALIVIATSIAWYLRATWYYIMYDHDETLPQGLSPGY